MLQLSELKDEIRALKQATIARQRRRELETAAALNWLADAPDAPTLRQLVKQQGDPGEQYALPVMDAAPLDQRFQPPGPPPRGTTVVAVDGSQISPDRHAAILYYLLQVGGMIFRYNGQAPSTQNKCTLHFKPRELYDQEGLLITGQLGQRRTVAELEYLAQLTAQARSAGAPAPLLALTDGPLLWPYSGRSEEENRQLLPAYFAAFSSLQQNEGMPVGFVERPGGRPLVNLLRLTRPSAGTNADSAAESSPDRLTDRELMARFLRPGDRSIWFKRDSAMNQRHARRGHAIWCAYLNVGTETWPVIARLETPAWAAQHATWNRTLHQVLLHQARVLHGHPYVLARAHELALVTHQDQAALNNLLQQQLVAAGIMTHISVKAEQKAYFGRK